MKVHELLVKLTTAAPDSELLLVETEQEQEEIEKVAAENGISYTILVTYPNTIYCGKVEGKLKLVQVKSLSDDLG